MVLVIEDQPDVLSSMLMLMDIWGFPARGARDGREALELIEGGLSPKVIFTDLAMPVMDGLEFLRRLRERERAGKLLKHYVTLLTGSFQSEVLSEAIRLSDCYMQKPADPNELRAVISGVTDP